jgi:hypothetical protein
MDEEWRCGEDGVCKGRERGLHKMVAYGIFAEKISQVLVKADG